MSSSGRVWSGLLPLTLAALLVSCGASKGAKSGRGAQSRSIAELETKPMAGPFAELENFCSSIKERRCLEAENAALQAKLTGSNGPWQAARILSLGEVDSEGAVDAAIQHCYFAAKTAKGWFTTELVYCSNQEFRSGAHGAIKPVALRTAKYPALAISLSGQDMQVIAQEDEEIKIDTPFETITLCGIGKSDIPSCTSTVSLRPEDEEIDYKAPDAEIRVDAQFQNGDLLLSRKGEKSGKFPARLSALLGRHQIHFP